MHQCHAFRLSVTPSCPAHCPTPSARPKRRCWLDLGTFVCDGCGAGRHLPRDRARWGNETLFQGRCDKTLTMTGRGRGRGQMTFSVEVVGISKGEMLPPPTLQPPPLYPSLEFKAVPLQTGEEAEYMLALKQELRGAMKNLPYYVKPAAPKKDIERYSDKYQSSGPTDNTIEWNPDWRRLPRELKIRIRKPMKDKMAVPTRKLKARTSVEKEEIFKKLETLEKKEEAHSSEEEGEQEKEEEEKENEEEYDEEEFEEETDYVMSYFDNGEEFGGDSDDNMDEAVY